MLVCREETPMGILTDNIAEAVDKDKSNSSRRSRVRNATLLVVADKHANVDIRDHLQRCADKK